MFKTSGGKYCTAISENTMKQSRFIEQIMVIGDGQKCQQLYSANFDFIKGSIYMEIVLGKQRRNCFK
jgi:long-chain acyl-CoA synthetase